MMSMKNVAFLILIFIMGLDELDACTIFCGKDTRGHVWAGNNEDFIFTFNTYLNLVATTDSTLGYMYFSYFNPGGYVQGGVNEAGLFFDGNAIKPSAYKDFDKKKDFPGGSGLFFHYILKKCKTVQEVFMLFKEYRLSGLVAAQIHLADKYGNFGIIVADSMWITKSDHQVSTNYNLCHRDKDGIVCWRFPIAERILCTREPGLDSFTEICDSTSQKSKYSTVYSNIHELTTGDIWFFYGMDYNQSRKTNIKELLKKGSRSLQLHELFIDEPLVRVYKTYQSEGVEESMKVLNNFQLPSKRKNEILRLLTSDLIFFNRDFRSYPFLATLIRSQERPDEFNQVLSAISLFCTGKKNEALDSLKKYSFENPKSTSAKEILNKMEGVFDEGTNARFELKGFTNAQHVFVDGISIFPIYNFMVKNEDHWVGHFKLEPAEYHYSFSVDGERVLDPENKDIVTDGNIEYNRILIQY
jgi:hypothetical protein